MQARGVLKARKTQKSSTHPQPRHPAELGLTERGQTSVPAQLRKELRLKPGTRLRWERISGTECRVIIEPRAQEKSDPMAALGFGPRTLNRPARATREWMKLLREGEK
jgi:bifunctional DNA-binding transcriptional regulator/antitoxin component of YhaV-PrlF toxin-antitoxin module